MPRRLAIARHAEGTSPVGWVLIGVLIGAATAVFALSHADWIKRLPDPLKAPATLVVAPPAKTPAPARLAMAATVVAPASDTQQAVAPASAQTSTMAAKPTPGEEAQVEEDAAAAGMTSHSGAASTDLN